MPLTSADSLGHVRGAPASGACDRLTFSLKPFGAVPLEELWTDLERRAERTFFLSWPWINSWLEQGGAPDFVLIGRADEEVVCLGLLRKRTEWRHGFVRSRTLYLHETGNRDQDAVYIEYNGLLTDRRFTGLAPKAFQFLRSSGSAGRFDEFQVGGAPETLLEEFRASGCRTQLRDRKPTAFVDLKAIREAGGDYLASLSANSRYQLRRALKIYEARGSLALQPARSTEEALRFFDELGILHEAGWRRRGSGGAWRYPFLVNMHRRIIETAFPSGGVDIARITCGDEPIGYIHCLVQGGWIGSYLSGFAYEADNKVKPGLVSFYLYIQHKVRSGGDIFDFLAGDHRYKASLGQPGPVMTWFRVQERRPQFKVEGGLRSLKSAIEALWRRRPSLRGVASLKGNAALGNTSII